jgi:hypothetical protein
MTLSDLELENERESPVQFDRFSLSLNQLAKQPITADGIGLGSVWTFLLPHATL